MKRNFGIDILKSVSMLFVVLVHIFGHGGILETVPLGHVNFYISNFVFVCIICAVNVFVICTGYLYADRKYNLSNIVSLWFQVFFYSVLISSVLYFLGYSVTGRDLLESFFPVLRDRYWFFTQYFALFLFIPLLNKIALNKILLKKVLIISFVLFSLVSTSLFKQAEGCSFLWFCVLYLIGAYIKLYYISKKNTLLYYFLSVTVYSVIYIFIVYLVAKGTLKQDLLYIPYTNPLVLFSAICLFLCFEKINIRKGTKIISPVSSLSFGVYLISDHLLVRKFFMTDKFICFANYPFYLFILYVFLCGIGIFAVCIIADYVRLVLFRLLHIKNLSVAISNFIQTKFNKIIS